jgi:creatinine amidohydrolase
MAGNIYHIEKLSFPQLDSLDRNKTVFIISISPLEEHGPHLPVGVDAMNAYYFAEHTTRALIAARPEYDVLLFPMLPLGTQVYRHLGSFYIKPSTLYDIVFNTGRSLAQYGFKHIFVLSAHGTPRQIVAAESACRKVSRKYKAGMVCLTGGLTVKFLNGEMYDAIAAKLGITYTAEEKRLLKYDYHAGWWETSMMLLLYPDLVDKSYTNLEPYLKDPITRKIITADRKWQGYYGAPAMASKKFAETSMTVFTDYIMPLAIRSLDGEDISREVNSPFGKYPFFHPHFKRNLLIVIVAIVFLAMIILLVFPK